jgi:hypothetical protein
VAELRRRLQAAPAERDPASATAGALEVPTVRSPALALSSTCWQQIAGATHAPHRGSMIVHGDRWAAEGTTLRQQDWRSQFRLRRSTSRWTSTSQSARRWVCSLRYGRCGCHLVAYIRPDTVNHSRATLLDGAHVAGADQNNNSGTVQEYSLDSDRMLIFCRSTRGWERGWAHRLQRGSCQAEAAAAMACPLSTAPTTCTSPTIPSPTGAC